MKTFKHELSNEISGSWSFHGYEGWRPAIAMPYFIGFGLKKARCKCGRKFKNQEEFEAHYLYMAVWKGESTVLPVEWKDLNKKTEEAK